MGLADIKAKARQSLHDFMARPASYYNDGVLLPTPITARRHDAPKVVGDLAGTNLSYAEVHERPTTVVLLRSELDGVSIDRGDFVIFEATEGWYIETVMPPDGLTITVEVTPMGSSGSNGLDGKTLPDGTVIGA